MTTKTKNRYPRETLERFRVVIIKKINKTQNLLSSLMSTLECKSSNETANQVKVYEDASEMSEQQSISSLAERQRMLLVNLEEAIDRVNDGTYGVCIITGDLISEERLMVVPHTEYSIEGKIPVRPTYMKGFGDKKKNIV